ncbi:MAG: hypothetical protein AB7P04_08015 [Bacteriovoracia bacterium]
MLRKIFPLVYVTLASWMPLSAAFADEVVDISKPNVVSVELLGRAVIYSLNYDRLVSDSIALGAGISAYSVSYFGAGNSYFLLPTYLNYYLSPKIGRGFFTGGFTFALSGATASSTGPFVGAGVALTAGGGYEYRYQGAILRAAGYFLVGKTFQPWLGVSAGLIF